MDEFKHRRPAGRFNRTALGILLLIGLPVAAAAAAESLRLSRADYLDRVHAVWLGQIAATLMTFPHEHNIASVQWLTNYPRSYTHAIVDDDWYYEMCAIRAFEKHGPGLTAAQLGEQWTLNNCGAWGSSEQARLALARGVPAPDCGHPRHNRLWFTIGPQFSADVYGALAPGMVNEAGRMARTFGHVNGYAEGADGAVFMAAMVSLGFVESDPRRIVRQAARLIHPDSPYRQCLDLVISLAEAGRSFHEIAAAIEDRWHIEYPATNNAVPNGGLAAAAVWFGEGDFLKTVNLVAGAADFTDADCNAANAAAVVGAMRGVKGIPPHLVGALNDRIAGEKLGPIAVTPPVDERISDLARRTAAVGESILLAAGATRDGDFLDIPVDPPRTQPAELFKLADLTKYWNPRWTLERAGFGGAGGGMAGIRGITYLEGDVLATYPRDEVRGVVLRRSATPGVGTRLRFEAGGEPGRAWELNVYINNKLLEKQLIEGGAAERRWRAFDVDLSAFAGQEVIIRLYQKVLLGNKTAGNALWKNLSLTGEN